MLRDGRIAGLRPYLTSRPALCAYGVSFLALLARLPYAGFTVVSADSLDYLARAGMIVDGYDLPDPLRTPGLPLLLAGLETVGIDPAVGGVVMQNAIGILLPAAVLLFGWRFFNPIAGVIAGALAALSPLLVFTEQYVLTDYLFGIFLFVATWLLAEGALRVHEGRRATRWLIAAGVGFGLATLMRGNGQYAVAAIPLAMLLSLRAWRPALRAAGVAVAAMVVVIAPWVIHNLVSYDTPLVTTLGGEALYVRVIDHDRIPPPDDTPEGKIARRVYNQIYEYAPSGQERNSGLILAGVLAHEGRDNVEVSSIMQSIALEAMSQNLSTYLGNTWDLLHEYQTVYDPDHEAGQDHIAAVRQSLSEPGAELTFEGRGSTPGGSSLTESAWQLGQGLERIVYLLSIAGLLSFALPFLGSTRARIAGSVLLTVTLLGFLVGAATEHLEFRYDMPYAPMVWLLMAGASVVATRFVIKFGRTAVARARAVER